jgi:hypothetical protein
VITLLVALAIGQQCQIMPDGSQVCSPSRQQVQRAAPQSDAILNRWRNVAVRVESIEPTRADGTFGVGMGTGIIVASDGHRATVLTNRHVVHGGQKTNVIFRGRRISARVARVSADADLAALEIASPVTAGVFPIASEQPVIAWAFAFEGATGTMHMHHARHLGATTASPRLGIVDSRIYDWEPHQGDSGGAIVNDAGQLAGIQWGGNAELRSYVVTTNQLRSFLSTNETCFRFFRSLFRPRQPNVVTQQVTVNPPAQPYPMPAPEPVPLPAPVPIQPIPSQPVPGPIGATGPQGPPGQTGATGFTGAPGPAGQPGAASMVPGPQGPPGNDGLPGAAGLASMVPGPAGPPGESGQSVAGTPGPIGATGPPGPPGATGVAGTSVAPTPAQIAAAAPLLQMTATKNGVAQVDATGAPVQKTYRAVPATDPTTGAPVYMYKVGMESDVVLHPTPSSPAPSATARMVPRPPQPRQ